MSSAFELLSSSPHVSGWASSGVEIAAKSFLWMAAAVMFATLFRAAPAAARHAVWVTALVSLLMLPVLTCLLPGWRVLPQWASPERVGVASAPGNGSSNSPAEGLAIQALAIQALPGQAAAHGPEWPTMENSQETAGSVEHAAAGVPSFGGAWVAGALFAWLAGATMIAARAMVSHLRLTRLARRSRVVYTGRTYDLLSRLCERIGVDHHVSLLLGPRTAMPMAWGLWRRVILLPEDAAGWNETRLRSVLLHELAHLRRRDPAVQLLVQVTLALYWFNPLVWLAVGRLKTVREQACDEAVISHGVRPCDYAEHLLGVVSGRRAIRWIGATALCMARTSDIENRLAWIVSFRGPPRAWTRRGMILLAAVILSATIPLAMLRAGDPQPVDNAIGRNPAAETSAEDGETPIAFDAQVTRVARLVDLSQEETRGVQDLSDAGQLAKFDRSLVLEVDSVDTLPALAATAGLDEAQTDEVALWVTNKRFEKIEQLIRHAADPTATENEKRLIKKLDQLWQRQRANLSLVEELLESDQLTAAQTSALKKLKSFINRQQLPSIYSVRQVFMPDGTGRSSWTAIFNSHAVPGKVHRMAILHAAVGGRIPIMFAGADETLFYIELTAGDDRSVSVRATPGDPQVQPPAESATYDIIRDQPVELAAGGHEFWLSYGSTYIARSSGTPTSPTANLFLTVKPPETLVEKESGINGVFVPDSVLEKLTSEESPQEDDATRREPDED